MASKEAYTDAERALYQRLANIALNDADVLVVKGRSYGDSWKQRGGIGAFMMLARKWDRIENAVKRNGYDVFQTYDKDMREEGIMDDIRDLRRYLLLVEDHVQRDLYSEMSLGAVSGMSEDELRSAIGARPTKTGRTSGATLNASNCAVQAQNAQSLMDLVIEESLRKKSSPNLKIVDDEMADSMADHAASISMEVRQERSVAAFCTYCLSSEHLEAQCPGKKAGPICAHCLQPGHHVQDCPERDGFARDD